ncbi:MAG: HAD-IIA family hydrolase [Flexilinea flocculi]|jgi:4-nitrophenyl phosphatase|nr:HAD-IIA family hydrolase [Flexilinea flocculi]
MDLHSIKALFLDMDGVLWHGKNPIGDLPSIFHKFQKIGIIPLFGTNNSTRTPEAYRDYLAKMGVEINSDQVITPAVGAAYLFQRDFSINARIHVFGSNALKEYLQKAGFSLVDENADIVLVSLDKEMTYQKVAVAMKLINEGAVFYATNLDNVLASENGWIPGGGVMVNAVQTCTGVSPIVIGKPNTIMANIACEKTGLHPSEILAVGDRYDTDILGGIRAGCRTALVLSGVDSKSSIACYAEQPDLICQDLNTIADQLLTERSQ